ncbi:MAG: class I SAM-dependent methyltransferase [Salinibacter sp.]
MSTAPPDTPSDQLLRTLASVPVSTPMLNLGCGSGRHAEALLRLGFPMHACDPREEAVAASRAVVRELVDDETAQSCVRQTSLEALDDLDATFDWVIADRTEAYLDTAADLDPLLRKARALLNPGGWLYLTLPAAPEENDEAEGRDDGAIFFAPSDLTASDFDTPFMEAQSPERVEENGETRLHALYRRVKRTSPK